MGWEAALFNHTSWLLSHVTLRLVSLPGVFIAQKTYRFEVSLNIPS